MRRRIGTGLALCVLLALSTTGAQAGTAKLDFRRLYGMQASGSMKGGTFSFWLQRMEGGRFEERQLSVLPTAQVPQFGFSFDRGPAQGPTSSAPGVGNALLQGCIKVKTSTGTDMGCGPLAGTSFNLDPAGQSGTVNFTVFSDDFNPRQLLVTLVLSGTTSIAPDADNYFTPTITPAPPAQPPYHTVISASQILTRGLTIVSGTVRSEHLAALSTNRTTGGGAINATRYASTFYTGVTGSVDVAGHELLCQGAEPNRTCVP
jgi:hypothetical protein